MHSTTVNGMKLFLGESRYPFHIYEDKDHLVLQLLTDLAFCGIKKKEGYLYTFNLYAKKNTETIKITTFQGTNLENMYDCFNNELSFSLHNDDNGTVIYSTPIINLNKAIFTTVDL